MKSVKIMVLLAWVIVFQDFVAPLLSPISEELCKGVECGKGTCKPSGNLTFLYDCECHPGWKQAAGLAFLPCVIPNCSIDFSCAAASPPVKDKESRDDKSIFDPCEWIDCGGGTCNKTSILTYNCECRENYYNLLNVSAFPCYQECAVKMDCSNLGIALTNGSASSPQVWLILQTKEA